MKMSFLFQVTLEALAVIALEQLFSLEVEFHRRLRTEAPERSDTASLHTSYSLMTERLIFVGDTRDVL